LGLSVSKKVGVAVQRNAVRRRLREIFRSASSDLPGGVDVVVSARAAAADAGFEELKQEFLAAMRKLNAQHAVGESLGGDV
jgi:ribonuclease P protein component